MVESDVLIIGSGIAGLSLALKLAEQSSELKITILTKSFEGESNTRYAQGGMAVVIDTVNDSFEKHIADTLNAGRGLSEPSIVELVVKNAPMRFKELIKWGIQFDTKLNGDFDLALEGGHSSSRIVHHKDKTGYEIEKSLLLKISNYKNIQFLHHHIAVDLIKEEQGGSEFCSGVYVWNAPSNFLNVYKSKITILCTGGCGQVFKTTTNPKVATGDGVAMASRAGVMVTNMHYIQFHPTALFHPGANPSFLISEAVRGYGAYLVDSKNRRFMFDFDKRGELATRDIVSNGIVETLGKSGEECVYLDLRHFNSNELELKFPTIINYLKASGFDCSKELIPVVPAAHYQCGGIQVGNSGQTSLENLFAIGECANTGLHGANRLASNSLIEALVFAHETATQIRSRISTIKLDGPLISSNIKIFPPNDSEILTLTNKVKMLMSSIAVHLNNKGRVEKIIPSLERIKKIVEEDFVKNKFSKYSLDLRNIVSVALLIVEDTLTEK